MHRLGLSNPKNRRRLTECEESPLVYSTGFLHQRAFLIISIGRQCSVMISIDADNPRRICECRFLGADSIIRPLRERLNQSLNEW